MKKARKLSCMVMGVFLAMSLAACGNATKDKAEDASIPDGFTPPASLWAA